MSHPSRSDLRLYERALRNGWDVPAETRAEVVRVLAEIVRDGNAKRRERTAAARALLQATRVELEAVRVAQGVLYEDLAVGWRPWRGIVVANWRKLQAGIERQERLRGTVRDRSAESARFDWYAAGCPCGLPPGECREHPRARASQRPPAGDWRTWLLLMAGRGFGKTRSAAEWVRHRVETGCGPADRPPGRDGGRRPRRDGRGSPAGCWPSARPGTGRGMSPPSGG